jgi:hypothetical protein
VHVADFGSKGHGDQERGTTLRLTRRNHWCQGPTWHDDRQLVFQAVQSLRCILDCIEAFLEDDLLRRVVERLVRKPAPVRPCRSRNDNSS